MSQYKADYTKINENKRFANEEIHEEVAEELSVSLDLVKRITSSNARFIRVTVERGALESVTLPYLGKLEGKLRSFQKAMGNVKRS